MASAQTLINGALRTLHVLESGEDPTADETADCLEAFNQMLASWSLERLNIYYQDELTHTLDGSQSYTIGSGGDIAETRPTKILSAFVRIGSNNYRVEVLNTEREYDSICDPTESGIPDRLYYLPEYPLGTIFVFPAGTGVLHFNVQTQLQSFAAATDTVSLPPGYERAIKFNLAIELATEFGQTASAEVVQMAAESKAAIKRINAETPIMEYSGAIPSNYAYDIEGG